MDLRWSARFGSTAQWRAARRERPLSLAPARREIAELVVNARSRRDGSEEKNGAARDRLPLRIVATAADACDAAASQIIVLSRRAGIAIRSAIGLRKDRSAGAGLARRSPLHRRSSDAQEREQDQQNPERQAQGASSKGKT
jgi:hypothetical protein